MIRRYALICALLIAGAGVAEAQPVVLENAFPGVTLAQVLEMQDPGSGPDLRYAVTKTGTIYALDPTGVAAPAVVLNLSARVVTSSEAGLVGLAFHPSYPDSAYIYVHYVTSGPLHSVISRFTMTDSTHADVASERILYTLTQPYDNHNGGKLAFGPADGFLYISFGDGGSGSDPGNRAQNRTLAYGKILRIDVDHPAGGKTYSVPASNPFVGAGDGTLPEIYALGLRNVWRFSFDGPTGRLWAADVGQGQIEEIDLIAPGKNYGWRRYEGTNCYIVGDGCDPTGLTFPVFEYNHAAGDRSITGGFVYRGSRLPGVVGKYVYGDFVSGRVWALTYDGVNPTTNALLLSSGKGISSFATDRNNDLYLIDFNSGTIFRFYGPNTAPTVAAPTGDRTLAPGNALTVDLATVFSDDRVPKALTYALVSNSDPAVASAALNSRTLTITALATGTTTITVRATDASGLTAADQFQITTAADMPLPVELSGLTGTSRNGAVVLAWQTAAEHDHAGFAIHRDGAPLADFRTTPQLTGHGTTATPNDYGYTDTRVRTGETHRYELRSISLTGAETIVSGGTITVEVTTSTVTATDVTPTAFRLDPAAPNPFNPTTAIGYALPTAGAVRLEVFDDLGRLVRTLVDGPQSAGAHTATFDAAGLPSGLYLYRLTATGSVQSRTMLLLR